MRRIAGETERQMGGWYQGDGSSLEDRGEGIGKEKRRKSGGGQKGRRISCQAQTGETPTNIADQDEG